jgi:hypothetical protein
VHTVRGDGGRTADRLGQVSACLVAPTEPELRAAAAGATLPGLLVIRGSDDDDGAFSFSSPKVSSSCSWRRRAPNEMLRSSTAPES